MNIVICLALVAIVSALAGAGYFMLKGSNTASDPTQRSRRMARALAWRVGLSVGLFLFVLVAYSLGWIEPRGIPLSR